MKLKENRNKEIKNDTFSNINELKEEYEKLRKIYHLPEFSELNKLFDIEEVDIETEFLLRKIRRLISERIANYIRFIEIILNPSNAPIFFFKLNKKLDISDRESLTKLYESLGFFEINALSLDVDYSESKEADFILKSYNLFNNDIKVKLLDLIKKLENGENNFKKDNNGCYFG
ncbi:MAG: hypothetical protein QXW97_02690 [Candidatus Pacearchaeota archaeon]